MAECGDNVGKGMISYPCTLTSGHEGPHKANENDASVRDRKLWETDRPAWLAQQEKLRQRADRQANPDQRHLDSGLGQFQGRAQTTAERYTENPTNHPNVTQDHKVDEAPHEQPAVYVESDDGTSEFRTATVPFEEFVQALGAEPSEVPEKYRHLVPRHHLDVDEVDVAARTAPTRSVPRPGEQGLPTINDRPNAQDALIQAIEERKAIGLERYGTLLQPFNGRNSFKDVLDEFVDGAVYGMALEMERREMLRTLLGVRESLVALRASGTPPDGRDIHYVTQVIDWLSGT